MVTIYITIAVLVLFNILIIMIYAALIKRLPPPEDNDLYDENDNHIYYDRKLIRQLEKEKQKQSGH